MTTKLLPFVIAFIFLSGIAVAGSASVRDSYVVSSLKPDKQYMNKATTYSGVFCSNEDFGTSRLYLGFNPEEIDALESGYAYLEIDVAQYAKNICQSENTLYYMQLHEVTGSQVGRLTWNTQPVFSQSPLDSHLLRSDGKYRFQISESALERMKTSERPMLVLKMSSDFDLSKVTIKEVRRGARIVVEAQPFVFDSDDDGLDDVIEEQLEMDVGRSDSDGNGISDYKEMLLVRNEMQVGKGKMPTDMCALIDCPPSAKCIDGRCIFDTQCKGGECTIVSTCSDTDEGKNANTYGRVTGLSYNGTKYSLYDSCVGSQVKERYCSCLDDPRMSPMCSPNNPLWEIMTCEPGFTCSEGRCVQAGSNFCFDSDGGITPSVFGHVNGTVNGSWFYHADSCMVQANGVNEWYCGQDYSPVMFEVLCPQGQTCEGGACTNQSQGNATCTDTDGGQHFYVQGSTFGVNSSGYNYNHTDYCYSGMLREFFCTAYGDSWINTQCGIGEGCVNGACTSSGYADLATVDLKFEDYYGNDLGNNWTEGQTIYPKIVIKNQGTQPQPLANIRYKIYLTSLSMTGYCDNTGKVMAVGETYKCKSIGGFTAHPLDTSRKGLIDSTYILVERNESNNERTEAVYVAGNTSTDYCIDSDGGMNSNVAGYVNGSINNDPYYYEDSCSNSISVYEWYCQNNQAVSTLMNCSSGKICVEGACVSTGTADLIVTDIVFEDGQGINLGNNFSHGIVFHPRPIVKNVGTANVQLQGMRHGVYFDGGLSAIGLCVDGSMVLPPGQSYKCRTANLGGFGQPIGQHTAKSKIDFYNIIAELNESNNERSEIFYVGGSPPSTDYCIDSDGGNNAYVYGHVNGSQNNDPYFYQDSCVMDKVSEWYCSGVHANNSIVTCISGMTCISGKCINITIADSCTEYGDVGYQFTIFGYVQGYSNGYYFWNHSDECINSTTIIERKCSGNYPMSLTYNCQYLNMTCISGVCTY